MKTNQPTQLKYANKSINKERHTYRFKKKKKKERKKEREKERKKITKDYIPCARGLCCDTIDMSIRD